MGSGTMHLCRIALGVVIGIAGACTADTVPPEKRDWGPLAVVVYEDPAWIAGTEERGQLTISGDCVVRSDEEGEQLLAWPSDRTVWDPDQGEIVFEDPELGTTRLGGGEEIEVHGDFGVIEFGGIPEWVAEPDDACPEWFRGLLVRRVAIVED